MYYALAYYIRYMRTYRTYLCTPQLLLLIPGILLFTITINTFLFKIYRDHFLWRPKMFFQNQIGGAPSGGNSSRDGNYTMGPTIRSSDENFLVRPLEPVVGYVCMVITFSTLGINRYGCHNPARGQLDREHIFSLSPFARENLVSREGSGPSRPASARSLLTLYTIQYTISTILGLNLLISIVLTRTLIVL